MNYKKWLLQYENGLIGKTVVLFGATGGIGRELCNYVLTLGGKLVTVDRNPKKAESLTTELKTAFPQGEITNLFADLADFASVQAVTEELKQLGVDILVHNAGAYSIPRYKTDLGIDNVYQINFVAPITSRRNCCPAFPTQRTGGGGGQHRPQLFQNRP